MRQSADRGKSEGAAGSGKTMRDGADDRDVGGGQGGQAGGEGIGVGAAAHEKALAHLAHPHRETVGISHRAGP